MCVFVSNCMQGYVIVCNFSNFPVLISMPVFATLCHVCAVAKIFLCLVCDLQKEDEGRGRSIK